MAGVWGLPTIPSAEKWKDLHTLSLYGVLIRVIPALSMFGSYLHFPSFAKTLDKLIWAAGKSPSETAVSRVDRWVQALPVSAMAKGHISLIVAIQKLIIKAKLRN